MWCISSAIPRFFRPTSPAVTIPSFHTLGCLRSFSPATEVTCTDTGFSEREEYRSPELVAREYADLNLSDKFCKEVGHVRIRQHVNPLRSEHLIPVEAPDWNAVYKDATLPLMVDIGTGSGRFLLWLAKRNPASRNFLGLEIRPKLVKRAAYWVEELALKNIHFVYGNAIVSFKQLVSTYPGPLILVSILCPDPYFKKKHHKRRTVQKPLVESIVDCLGSSGQVFIQSDVLEVALDMREYFDAESDKIAHIDSINHSMLCDNEGWLLENPMGIRTEREIHAELEGARMYRRLYQKQREMKDQEKGVYSHGGGYNYPPTVYPHPHQHGYGYPQQHGYGYPSHSHGYSPLGYPPMTYPPAAAYPPHSGIGGIAAAAAYGANHMAHGGYMNHPGGYYGHGKLKHGKFGKHNHGMYGHHMGKFKKWK